ncbi:MAG: IS110 family transposase [Alphaproteobacteria bacterium]|nr:IS110 family transposase [Alphaproteobacteria bacterium]MBT5389109.1 IS110 family transposase [Alphaproteobacteria bacterium]MBT5654002.1 IS110 family transposase [Alphaproteobacteria bacterium]
MKAIAHHLQSQELELTKVGLESGSLSHWLTTGLCEEGLAAICIDSRKMAAILSVQINKTDKNDARGIADALRCNYYKEVELKSWDNIGIISVLKSRKRLVEQRIQLTNSIRGMLKAYGVRLGPIGVEKFSECINKTLNDLPEIFQKSISSLLNCIDQLIEEVKKLDKLLNVLAAKDAEIKLLMTVPGVGRITAIAYKCALDDPSRFKDPYNVGAYFGLTPRQYSSGERVLQAGIFKCGNTDVRSLLMEAALVMLTRSKKWSRLKVWGIKIAQKRGTKKAMVAVARKLSIIMCKMLISKSEFQYGQKPA